MSVAEQPATAKFRCSLLCLPISDLESYAIHTVYCGENDARLDTASCLNAKLSGNPLLIVRGWRGGYKAAFHDTDTDTLGVGVVECGLYRSCS